MEKSCASCALRSKNQKSVNHCRNTVKYNGDDFCQYIDKSISTL